MFKLLISSLLCGVLGFGSAAHAQEFPNRPVRIVVPFTAGGGVDLLGRALAEKLQTKWGQTVVVENRPGASGNLAAEYVYKSPADGYTLFLGGDGVLAVNKMLYGTLNFEPEKFESVSVLSFAPLMVVVNTGVPVRSLQELIAYGKAHPGKLSFSSAGKGGASHLATELFQKATGTQFVHVPYKGIQPAFNDVVARHVDMMFGFEASVGAYMHGDKIRVLAVTGTKRHPALPNVPTVSEVVPNYVAQSWTLLVAPPGTPAPVVQKIEAAVVEVLRMPDVITRLRGQGYEAAGTSAADAKAFLRKETEHWQQAIKAAGITPD